MTELSDAIASRRGYEGLTPPELAAAEKNVHLSMCPVPRLADCGRCEWELDTIRAVLRAAAPVVEEEARADERRKVLAELPGSGAQ